MTGEVIPAILKDIRRMGVCDEDFLVVHSSFRSLGLVHVSPSDIVCTLIQAIGAQGTLMMPTFTYCYSGVWNAQAYNPETTPSLYMGILPETLRQHPGALRSGSPIFSVAAIGKHAERVTSGKELAGGLGAGSSFEDAYQLGAKILLLGVGNNRNSMIHYAEYTSGLPVGDIPYRSFWGCSVLIERDGEQVEAPIAPDFPGCSANFGVMDEYLIDTGIMTHGKICSAISLFMDARQMVDSVAERLRQRPDWLFCESIACEACAMRRRRLRERGLI